MPPGPDKEEAEKELDNHYWDHTYARMDYHDRIIFAMENPEKVISVAIDGSISGVSNLCRDGPEKD